MFGWVGVWCGENLGEEGVEHVRFVLRVCYQGFPYSKSAMPVLSFCSGGFVGKYNVLCVIFFMFRYLNQVCFLAFLYNNFCLRWRGRFVSVVIHDLWILEVGVFVGMFLSMILSKLSLIVPT